MINPDAVRAQVEGNILQTLSRTLYEETTFDRSRVTSVDWSSYRLLRFPEVPRLEIALIDRPDLAAGGRRRSRLEPGAGGPGQRGVRRHRRPPARRSLQQRQAEGLADLTLGSPSRGCAGAAHRAMASEAVESAARPRPMIHLPQATTSKDV